MLFVFGMYIVAEISLLCPFLIVMCTYFTNVTKTVGERVSQVAYIRTQVGRVPHNTHAPNKQTQIIPPQNNTTNNTPS